MGYNVCTRLTLVTLPLSVLGTHYSLSDNVTITLFNPTRFIYNDATIRITISILSIIKNNNNNLYLIAGSKTFISLYVVVSYISRPVWSPYIKLRVLADYTYSIMCTLDLSVQFGSGADTGVLQIMWSLYPSCTSFQTKFLKLLRTQGYLTLITKNGQPSSSVVRNFNNKMTEVIGTASDTNRQKPRQAIISGGTIYNIIHFSRKLCNNQV